MLKNPFADLSYVNDTEDLKVPYRFCGKTDREVTIYRYLKLKKSSHGYIIRLGQASNG